jgi:hypothetical protein
MEMNYEDDVDDEQQLTYMEFEYYEDSRRINSVSIQQLNDAKLTRPAQLFVALVIRDSLLNMKHQKPEGSKKVHWKDTVRFN